MAVKSKFRLTSSAFERKDESEKRQLKKLVFLSVEGSQTEMDYFNSLNGCLDNSVIKIETLRHLRSDGYSDPEHVIELLEEAVNARESGPFPVDESVAWILNKYGYEFIDSYLKKPSSVDPTKAKELKADLLQVGIDLDYRKHLSDLKSEGTYFCVVLDRDEKSRSKDMLSRCVKRCEEKGYHLFLSNPCFEFFLLLHVCDVKNTFSQQELEDFKENRRISDKHTAVSQALTDRAHHSKKISGTKFARIYFPNIKNGAARAKGFATTFPDLYDNLGTNLFELFSILGII